MRQLPKTEDVKTGIVQVAVGTGLLTLATATIILFCGSCQGSAPVVSGSESRRPFFEKADFDPAIPSPETVIGHGVGEKAV